MTIAAIAGDADALLMSILDPATDGARYPLYEKLRDVAPVFRTSHPLLDGWYMVSGYDNIQKILVSSKSTANGKVLELINARDDGAFSRMNRTWMKFQDRTADHDRIRRLLQPHFTPSAIAADRLLVRGVVQELLSDLDGTEMDLVAGFAFPLPLRVVARKLGIAPSDMCRFQTLVDQYMAYTATVRDFDSESLAMRDEMTERLLAFFGEYLDSRRREPQDDLISKLGANSAAGNVTDEELLAQFVFLLIAGHTTTGDMIGNALVALAAHPAQRRLLEQGSVDIGRAIDELIRFDTSLAVGMRCVNEDLELPGGTIPCGSSVMLVYPSAHRDPAIFERPNLLDLTREFPRPPLPFGGGRYFCLGSYLAKLEIEEALTAILRRMPDYQVIDVTWQGGLVAHGPKRLVVRPSH